jgi:hypothetical protein
MDDDDNRNKEFFEGWFDPKKCREVLEKRSKKLIRSILCFVFLERIDQEIFEKFDHGEFFIF